MNISLLILHCYKFTCTVNDNKEEGYSITNIIKNASNILTSTSNYMKIMETFFSEKLNSKEDASKYLDKLAKDYSYPYNHLCKSVVLSLFDCLNNPPIINDEKSDNLPDDVIKKVEVVKTVKKDNTFTVIPDNIKYKLCQEVMSGDYTNVPNNLYIEDSFITFLLSTFKEVSVDEYNNIADFLKIVVSNKDYVYNDRLAKSIPKRTWLVGTDVGLVEFISDMIIVFLNRKDEVLKAVDELGKILDEEAKKRKEREKLPNKE